MTTQQTPPPPARIHVFIDFWNLQLGMRDKTTPARFEFDWETLPRWLAEHAAELAGLPNYSYEGTHVYASYDPLSAGDVRLRGWMENWLSLRPGVSVMVKQRTRKRYPVCPHCHDQVVNCNACGGVLSRTEEKGVDTAIVTDMIRLAWEDAYDVAVIVSSDRDFIPAVQFLDDRGLKVIQAGFPPVGTDLARSCWGAFDIYASRHEFERKVVVRP